MNKTATSIIVAILLVIGGAFLLFKNTSSTTPTDTNPTDTSANTSPADTSTGITSTSTKVSSYTLADVAKHKDASSCWAAINGGVYDLTAWIDQHPGGPDRILSICGTDGSAAFDAQHGGQGRPAEMLATFKIGVLTN
jgi:cytochrome b involved in lipid metabolism